MKKILLSLVAVFAAMSVSADDAVWQKTFSPISSADDLTGVHTAVAVDGSVYASSTTDQGFTFGATTIERDNNAIYSCLVKYDKEGTEKWAVLVNGESTITAMTTDADGNVYVGGTFKAASLAFNNADGTSTISVEGSADVTSGFIAKVSAEGVVQTAKAFTPQVDAEVGAAWNTIFDEPAYADYAYPMTVSPNKIVVDGDKVYVSALYRGDVPSLGWEGHYTGATYDMGMGILSYYDNSSYGVFSLNMSDLNSSTSIVTLGSTDLIVEEKNYRPEAFTFVVNDGGVYVAFFGWGKLTLAKSATDKKDFSFAVSTDPTSDANEYAFVLSTIANLNYTITFNNDPYELSWDALFNLYSDVIDGKAVIGGTFQGVFPLDKDVVSNKNMSFVALANLASSTVTTWTNQEETEGDDVTSVARALIVTGEETHLSTEKAVYHFKTANLANAGEPEDFGVLDANQKNDQYVGMVSTDEAMVVVMGRELEQTAVEAVKAATVAGGAKFYGIDGVELSAPQKGVSIVKTADGVKKIIK